MSWPQFSQLREAVVNRESLEIRDATHACTIDEFRLPSCNRAKGAETFEIEPRPS